MKKIQQSDTLFVGLMLAISAGFLNGYTYLVRGGVFASLQTGNIIFTGLALADGNFERMLLYIASILSFAVGVFVTEAIRSKFIYNPHIHWRQIVVYTEIVVVGLTVFIPVGDLNMLANCLISFVCAMQIESFRKINGIPSFTTIMTGALRSATQKFYAAVVEKDKESFKHFLQYVFVISSFMLGVIASKFFVVWFSKYAVLVSTTTLFIACIGMNHKHNRHHRTQYILSQQQTAIDSSVEHEHDDY